MSLSSSTVSFRYPDNHPLLDNNPQNHPQGSAAFLDININNTPTAPSFALDLATVPLTLEADDPGDQDTLDHSILRAAHSQLFDTSAYNNAPLHSLSLSHLQHLYNHRDKRAAAALLTRKNTLSIDPLFTFPISYKGIAWQVYQHRLDYLCRIPNSIGFHAVLPNISNPNIQHPIGWMFKMSFKHHYLTYPGDIRVLAFNPRAAMLSIGQSHDNESVWWTLFPPQALEPYPSIELMTSDTGPSTMDPILARINIACLLCMMHHAGYTNFYLPILYPDVSSNSKFIASVGNLLIPAAVILKYGQDRQVCAPPTAHADTTLWDQSCDYSKLACVAFALATHYRISQVRDWTPIDPYLIKLANPTIYTTPDPDTRKEIDALEDYPLLDSDDREIQVFAPNGRRIPRHSVTYFEPYEPCAVLQNLGHVSQLFASQPSHDNRWTYNDDGAIVCDRGPANPDKVEVDAILNGIDPPSVHLYPLGFTRHGQWQANGVIDPLRRHISTISRSLKLHDGGGPAVEPIKSQCYNNIAHYTRHSARHHIAQHSVLTSTTGGAWAKMNKTRATASTLYAACAHTNPHADLCGQLERADQTFLRFKNVYTVHCKRLPDHDRTSHQFHLKVMIPLTGACAHPTVLDAIKNTSTVFCPDVFPNLILWTTYPVRVLLDLFWVKVSPALIVGSNATPNPVDLELIAVLKRLVNFAHTGAMKVLTTGVMDRLWPSRAIIDNGFPCFSPALFLGGKNGLLPSIDLHNWPTHSITEYPLVVSKCALEITYGNTHFTVSNTVRVAGESNNILAYRIKVTGTIVAQAFVNDVKAFVKEHTLDETQHPIDDPTHIDHDFAVSRRRSLKSWLKSSQPLNYGTNNITFADLIHTVSSHPEDLSAGLPPSTTRSTSIKAFIDKIYSWALSSMISPRAPLYKNGSTGIVLRTIISEAACVLRGHSNTERSTAIKRSIVRALSAAQVHFIPDARPNHARTGSPSHQPSIHAWTTLGAAPQARALNHNNAHSNTERIAMQLNASARILKDSNVCGDWAFNGLQIQNIHSILDCIVTPIDWSTAATNSTKGC
ncbi:hypothetical protein BC628DRAFT_1342387 [Trametes gibbosa]|nr:hypothetical protein BC628DRAFT_1342387 [Trametes gibbosa]